MPFTPTEVQAIAATEAAKVTHLSLHKGNPGTTGANEASGAPYARKTTTVTAVGGVGTSTEVLFDLPGHPTDEYNHFGVWAGATFIGGNPLSSPKKDTEPFQVKLTVIFPITAS
ncbi:hypothetical protein [Cryobacterium sp. BB736]|uniref:phage tail fiber protein n=1 Tax=Cryobacterium sp. BB736 TaxID=2746963 RepID=UPI001873927E|nr:hypothetical protein [Cryobacterium sp. BB736]